MCATNVVWVYELKARKSGVSGYPTRPIFGTDLKKKKRKSLVYLYTKSPPNSMKVHLVLGVVT